MSAASQNQNAKLDTPPASQQAPETRGATIHWASRYDAVTGLLLLGNEQSLREMTAELAQVKPGDQVLDVGCGTGSLTIAAKIKAGPTGQVHGIDVAPEMIDVAHRKAVKKGLDIDFQIGLIEDIRFPDNQFDIVLSSLMLHHLPADLKLKGFAEIYRVLKPGGRFLAVDFEPPTNPLLRHLTHLLIGHRMMESNVRELPVMMQEAGFAEVETGITKYKVIAFVRGTAKKAPFTS